MAKATQKPVPQKKQARVKVPPVANTKARLFKFWTLVNKTWVEQEPIKALNRVAATESVRAGKTHREGTWKLRLA